MRKPQNLKKSPTGFDKTAVFTQLSSVKTIGRFFQVFVAFSEKLDFTSISDLIRQDTFATKVRFCNARAVHYSDLTLTAERS